MDEAEEFIEHHGVKGMRWGVRKAEDTSSGDGSVSPDLAKHIESTRKTLTASEKARVAESEAKHDAHFEASEDPDPKGWRPTGKQVAVAAVGALFVAGVVYKLKTGKSIPTPPGFSAEEYLKEARESGAPGWLKQYGGKHMSVADFKGISETSKERVWSGNYITKESFARKEMSFAPGHEFFRVSHRVEETFHPHTFATASKEDAARYFLGWKDQTTHLINFKAKEEVKIPDLHTVLETVREHMVTEGNAKPKPAEVIERLNRFTGSDFSNPNGIAIVNRLKAKGFHGIIDYMDEGVYGESPMVLFDPSKLTSKVTTLRENVDVAGMTKLLVDLPNRR